MGSPYTNQSRFLKYDRLVYHLQKQYKDLIWSNVGATVISNYSSKTSFKSSKKITAKDRQVIEWKVPANLSAENFSQFESLNESITKKLKLLKQIESKIDSEVSKLENFTSFEDDKTHIIEYCRKWFEAKQETLELYKERYIYSSRKRY